MSYTQLNPQYNPLFANVLNYDNWAEGVADLARGYAVPLQIIDALNPGGSQPMDGPQGVFNIAYYPRQEVQAYVASVTQDGANLIVTWSDPTYDGFRPKFMVQDSNHNQAYVVSSSAGGAILSPGPGETTLDATTQFQIGYSVSDLGSGSANHYSTGVLNLYKEPQFRYNYSAVTRESYTVSRREKFQSRAYMQTVMSWTVGEVQMIQRFMKNKVKNFLYSRPGQFNTAEGLVNRFEGLRWATINQGGRFISSPTLPTLADIKADIAFLAQSDPNMYQDYLWIIGRQAWDRINTLFSGDITYTVSKATVNGNQLNFDIPQVTINGVTLKLMIIGLFDDKYLFPKMSTITGAGLKESNTYAMVNLAPIPSAVGGGMVPSVRKFHFASSTLTNGAPTIYTYIPGMVSPGNGNTTGGNTMGKYSLGTSTIDGGQFEVLEDGGLDIQGDVMVWRELST